MKQALCLLLSRERRFYLKKTCGNLGSLKKPFFLHEHAPLLQYFAFLQQAGRSKLLSPGMGAARLRPGEEVPSHFLHRLHCLVPWTSRPPGSELAACGSAILPAMPFTQARLAHWETVSFGRFSGSSQSVRFRTVSFVCPAGQ